eukprot:TRINITY_DN29065_c0_g1_i1.p1 TRINITY_DN29065_c0_g1~~TRINITY_DN29065_c0_g1_i1.p1  ORF type:complete len:754 (+),score=97.95 TRINITY_DN29065_c0_g1_i1:48-2264(+)
MEKNAELLEAFVADKLRQIEQMVAAEHVSLNAHLKAELAMLRETASKPPQQDAVIFDDDAYDACPSADKAKILGRESICKGAESDILHPAIPMVSDLLEASEPQSPLRKVCGSDFRVVQAGVHNHGYSSPSPSQMSGNSMLSYPQQTMATEHCTAKVKLLQCARRRSVGSVPACDSLLPINTNTSLRDSFRSSHMLAGELRDFKLRESFGRQAIATTISRKGTAGLRDLQNTEPSSDSFCRAIHPDSWLVMAWDLVSIVLAAKDLVIIPLHAFDAIKGRDNGLVTMARCYWTVNVCLRFFIGYEDKGGQSVTTIVPSAKNYAKTWFALDLLYVLLDWLMPQASSGTALQFILQLVRLMLGKHIKELINYIAMHVRSESASLMLSVTKAIMMLVFVAHLLACGWYRVSRLDGDNNWVRLLNLEGESFWLLYAVAVHWSFLQYSGESLTMPQNGWEQAYTISVQFVAYVLSAIMMSNLTSLMTQLELLSVRNNQQVSILKRFLSDNKVSTKLAGRIVTNALRNIEEKKRRMPENAVSLLNEISIHLLVELHYNLNAHHLVVHPFFLEYDTLNQHGMRNLCHMAVKTEFLAAGDVLFSIGEVATDPCMYFVGSGCSLAYDFDDRERILLEGTCVNEAALWLSGWEQVGTLRTKEATQSVQIVVQPCLAVMMQFRQAECHPGNYALAFLREVLNTIACELTDIASDFLDLESVASAAFGKKPKLSGFSSVVRKLSDKSALRS